MAFGADGADAGRHTVTRLGMAPGGAMLAAAAAAAAATLLLAQHPTRSARADGACPAERCDFRVVTASDFTATPHPAAVS